ncbi:MAG: helix-turn-helix domain-containing protein [Variovorax sp.]
MTGVAEYLMGQARSRVLAELFLHPERALHVRELARATGVSPGSLHRELRGLSETGLLLRDEIGRQVHYRANAQSPVFAELAGLLRKTIGIADVLRDALSTLRESVQLAFVYGSVAAGTESPHSDIDVMVLGTAGFAAVALALGGAAATLGREVNPTPMSVDDFAQKVRDGQGFATSVVASPRIWLKGEEDEFAKLVAYRKAQGTRSHGA